MILRLVLAALTLLLTPTAAQFGNIFEQMFGGGGGGSSQQHAHGGGKQNVASDSKWYQETWSSGTHLHPPVLSFLLLGSG